jgi:hypothetical protein
MILVKLKTKVKGSRAFYFISVDTKDKRRIRRQDQYDPYGYRSLFLPVPEATVQIK